MGTEECSSSESGWTMYIASPMEEDDAEGTSYDGYNVDKNKSKNKSKYKNKNKNETKKRVTYNTYAANEEDLGSDDSTASDAASGPSYQQYYHGRSSSHCKDSHGKKDKKQPSNKKDKKSGGEKNTRRK